MATTTNFGWETPDDTDLVKDGAAAIRTALGGVDTSFVDLKGGTTGQVLSKASNTDLDFSWVAQDDSNAIQNAIVDAKGDLIAATAADTPARLAVGTNGQVLTADSTTATGLKWAAASGGASGMTFITSTSFSNVASQAFDSVFTSTYRSYLVVIDEMFAAGSTDDLFLQFRYAGNTTQASLYYGSCMTAAYNSSSVANTGTNNGSSATIAEAAGGTGDRGSGYFYVSQVAVSSGSGAKPIYTGQFFPGASSVLNTFGGYVTQNRTNFDGFLLSSATNITGRVTIYGLAAA